MRVTLLPSCTDPSLACQYLTTFLVNGAVAVDAGALGFWGDPAAQAAVRHVFLTHAHLDHTASLPIFLENVFSEAGDPPAVYATRDVLAALRTDVFNDRLFPDFLRIGAEQGRAFVTLHEITPGVPVAAAGLRVTAVPVDHTVPTVAFLVEDGTAAAAIVTDTAATAGVWELARRTPHLKAVFLEATFPRSLRWLAEVSKHLDSDGFAREVAKAPPGVPVFAVHQKARYRAEIAGELAGLPNVSLCEPGREYLL